MNFDTYITIIFTILTTFLVSNSLPKIFNKRDKKLLGVIILIIIATIIYKFDFFHSFCLEIISSISKCIPFFRESLLNINNNKLPFFLGIYLGLMIEFLIGYTTEKQFTYEDLFTFLSFIGAIIYIITNGFFFIFAYYLLYNTDLHIVSYILFIIIIISSFSYKYVLFYLLSIQRKIQDWI